MFRNYMTVALRSLAKNKLYSAINIFGLAVGLASCVLILLYVSHELSYDRTLADADRIYQVQTRFDVPGRTGLIAAVSSGAALPALTKDFPQIETGTRLMRMRPVLK